jgi:hypothetical protein
MRFLSIRANRPNIAAFSEAKLLSGQGEPIVIIATSPLQSGIAMFVAPKHGGEFVTWAVLALHILVVLRIK